MSNATEQVKQVIDDLIQTATSYDVEALDRIYHDELKVLMIDHQDNLSEANKDAFIELFKAKKQAGDPPMDTWAKYHSVVASGDSAHVLLSRKNNLSGHPMKLLLSIDLKRSEERWQVYREVIHLQPDA
ncbi:hypothetical protein [Aliagarivorans marinus]|uniref:hypothetical protein n=1 Tax=Aliagarivorans marinus TaxID=561965 RepID=UPI00040F2845|nr:hypothetical protein [Aliagarivorans marinus]